MSTVEYLLFIPLLIYGIAIADLLSQWKQLLETKSRYLPYTLLTILLTEVAVYNVYSFLQKIDVLDNVTYAQYWLYLLPPLIFLMAISALVSDKNEENTEVFFLKRAPVVFSLLALYTAFHLLPSYSFHDSLAPMRVVIIILAILIALTKNMKFFYALSFLWAVSLVFRLAYKVT